MGELIYISNSLKKQSCNHWKDFNSTVIDRVRRFHTSIPGYCETPTHNLRNLADYIGLHDLYVKDESFRFGLNAFKILGSSYALADRILSNLDKDLTWNAMKEVIPEDLTLITATDGNHGFSLAYLARNLGCKAQILMPEGTAIQRLERIRELGADAEILQLTYDECVSRAEQLSKEIPKCLLIQDVAWEGYEDIPLKIMQGYSTILIEAQRQIPVFQDLTHVFLQAGAGSFASGLTAMLSRLYHGKKPLPTLIVVEPRGADCFYRSFRNGILTGIKGKTKTVMAGLNCGTPSKLAWPILRDISDGFLTVDDSVSLLGMRILNQPLEQDPRIVSGESGAVCLGVVYKLMTDSRYQSAKDDIGLNTESKVLLISTEGDTDPIGFRRAVWDGNTLF